MPQSSGSAHTHGESQQSGVSQGLAPQLQASMEAPEPAQATVSVRGSRNRLATSSEHPVCSDRILTCRIKSICSPAKGGTGCYRFNYQPGS